MCEEYGSNPPTLGTLSRHTEETHSHDHNDQAERCYRRVIIMISKKHFGRQTKLLVLSDTFPSYGPRLS